MDSGGDEQDPKDLRDPGEEPTASIEEVSLGPIKRFGRYTLLKKLATGGMAEIWLARQRGIADFHRFVVIKKILAHLAEEESFRTMFLQEARMSSLLSHPNIVQVFDLGEADGSWFIAMEYIAGENLAVVAWRGVKRALNLSPAFAARIVADACKALHYAHHLRGPDGKALELVHRDISPQNILLTYEGEVKVVDFGIAKAASGTQGTNTGTLKGKFSYMSPEQCQGEPLDKRSDVFALGIVLYELCTGKRLFKHESELMILDMITRRRVTPPSQVVDGVPPELDAIIMKSLEKPREERFQTAQDFGIALEDYLKHDPTPSSHADLASYMRSLFSDKIEEKRRLVELGSKLVDERRSSIAPAPRRPSSLAPPPNRVSVGPAPFGAPPPVAPNLHPQQLTVPRGSAPPMPPHVSLPPPDPAPPAWVPPVAGAMLALATVLFGAWLWLGRDTATINPPPMLGRIEVLSEPKGALILLDGEPVPNEHNQPARTPTSLSRLEYGERYNIRITLEGYTAYDKSIVMDEALDGTSIFASLLALPGHVEVSVPAELVPTVTVRINGSDEGRSPIIERALPAGHVTLTAADDRPDWSCTVTPAEIVLARGARERATVRCGPRVRTPPPPTGGGVTHSDPHPDGRKCTIRPDVPPGLVTIDTTPYSEVYFEGKKLGETPLPNQKLPAGCVRLKLVNPANKETVEVEIQVEPNAQRRFRHEFRAKSGT